MSDAGAQQCGRWSAASAEAAERQQRQPPDALRQAWVRRGGGAEAPGRLAPPRPAAAALTVGAGSDAFLRPGRRCAEQPGRQCPSDCVHQLQIPAARALSSERWGSRSEAAATAADSPSATGGVGSAVCPTALQAALTHLHTLLCVVVEVGCYRAAKKLGGFRIGGRACSLREADAAIGLADARGANRGVCQPPTPRVQPTCCRTRASGPSFSALGRATGGGVLIESMQGTSGRLSPTGQPAPRWRPHEGRRGGRM